MTTPRNHEQEMVWADQQAQTVPPGVQRGQEGEGAEGRP